MKKNLFLSKITIILMSSLSFEIIANTNHFIIPPKNNPSYSISPFDRIHAPVNPITIPNKVKVLDSKLRFDSPTELKSTINELNGSTIENRNKIIDTATSINSINQRMHIQDKNLDSFMLKTRDANLQLLDFEKKYKNLNEMINVEVKNRIKTNEININSNKDEIKNEIASINNENSYKLAVINQSVNKQLASIQEENTNKNKEIESKLKETESNLNGALISIAAADQVTGTLNTNIDLIDKKITKNTNIITTIKSDALKTQNDNDKKFTAFENKYDNAVNQLDNKIDKRSKEANSGIASVAAMSNIPYATNTRFSAGFGAGNYKNGTAIAAGAQYQLKENLNLRSSISWNNSDSAVMGAGIAFGW